MGCLAKMSNMLVNDKSELLRKSLETNNSWQLFVSVELAKINARTHPT